MMAEEPQDMPQADPAAENAAEPDASNPTPDIDVNVEEAGTWKKKVTVTVPAEQIQAKRDELYGELMTSANVPGFRVGRAPRRLVERRFAKEVAEDVRNSLVGQSLGSAIEQENLRTLGEPEIDLDAIEVPTEGDMVFDFQVEVTPEFELPELAKIPVEKKIIEIDDARVNEYFDQFLQARATYEDTDEPVEAGDVVVGAVTVTPDGLEPVHRPGETLRAAPGQVEGIPVVELGEHLTGARAGQSVSFEVEIPESHPNEEWQGKKAQVEIAVSQVRRRQTPVLDEAFATSMGFDSLEEMKDYVRQRLESQVEHEQRQAMLDQIRDYLVENTEFELPEGVAARHSARVAQRRAVDLMRRGVPREQIEENITELQAAAGEQAARELREQFILGRVAEEREIDVTEDEINARIAGMAQMYNRRPEKMRQELEQDGTLNVLSQDIIEEKTLNSLLEDAEVSEVEAAEEADESAPAAESSDDNADEDSQS